MVCRRGMRFSTAVLQWCHFQSLVHTSEQSTDRSKSSWQEMVLYGKGPKPGVSHGIQLPPIPSWVPPATAPPAQLQTHTLAPSTRPPLPITRQNHLLLAAWVHHCLPTQLGGIGKRQQPPQGLSGQVLISTREQDCNHGAGSTRHRIAQDSGRHHPSSLVTPQCRGQW